MSLFSISSILLLSALSIISHAAPLGGKLIGRDTALLASYDFIIIGGGTSGLVVGNRLSENPATSVLIIEAGELDQGEDFIYVPLLAGISNGAIGTKYDWNLTYSAQQAADDREIAIPLGKVVGGGSCLNKMVFDIAGKVDYDQYFFAAMKFLGIRKVFDSLNGDANGALWNPQSLDPDTKTRSNSRTAYWNSASNRTNLHLLTRHQATKLITHSSNGKVPIIGVEYATSSNSTKSTVLANKEVILAAGAIHSPQLLQLSGIGEPSLLKKLGINTVVNLPGVGANFQDHPLLASVNNLNIALSSNNLTSNSTYNAEMLALYRFNKTAKYARKIINTPTFAPLSPVDIIPGPAVQSESDFETWIRSTISSTYHPSGTTSMMKRQLGGVVDSNFKVYGVRNLRVVDAGTFPMIQAAHLQATVRHIDFEAGEVEVCGDRLSIGINVIEQVYSSCSRKMSKIKQLITNHMMIGREENGKT
ncbi:hypothetical protein SS1G_01811 [Sclerotinia sclerotiorum 1980 UF-70]|uniref:Glucose-methanol-choline oxidoreductase N-terminal domain-containing protein n=1 Tax=Sclerotinia sclerotiorum (strain ATCC 18683 / 1980 / Ss-1) TaxID=665079 RepID=A7E931_SCLS1|nr:hypothetical protein SS1G_01811 [Sclerotinia sclerotiorum 1980 UF-70]EDN96883.1 hypothetical protein SS1G_01811 [Sclerotinia sclerotiorum 1980 UF-70]